MKIPNTIIENYLYTNFSDIKTSNGELHFNTPFSTNDNKKRLYVNTEDGTFYDQKNQFGGTFEKFVSLIEDINVNDVIYFLIREYSNGQFSFFEKEIKKEEEKKIKLELPKGLKFFKDAKPSPIANRALKYLFDRKIPKEFIKQMGYIFEPGTAWNNRVFIPFYENKNLVYFVARAFDDNTLRYKNPDLIDTKEFVFNYDNIEEEVAICEGVFDALSITNIPATAIMSADIGVTQIKKLVDKNIKKIIMVPDNDETGNKTLDKNIEKILYYSPPSNEPKILIYTIPKEFKDFNQFMVETGCNEIRSKDCVLYKKTNFLFKSFKIKTPLEEELKNI